MCKSNAGRLIKVLFMAVLFAYAGSVYPVAYPDMPVNKWVKVKTTCVGGKKDYSGGCPSGRAWLQMTYDTKRQKMVLFGGSGEWYFNDLWYYDPLTRVWELVLQDTRLAREKKNWSKYPKGRDNHQLVYDESNDVYWMYGGTGGGGFWIFDPKRKEWERVRHTHDGKLYPRAVHDTGFAYSKYFKGILLYGGELHTFWDKTWWFDTSKKVWSQIRTGVRPVARAQIENALVFDKHLNKFVLFGGRNIKKKKLSDTWVFDMSSKSWRNMRPTISPGNRDQHMMVYDSKNRVVVMFGGSKTADTWIYNTRDNTWKEVLTAKGGYNAKYSNKASAVYAEDMDLIIYRDIKGNMYHMRLDLSREFIPSSAGIRNKNIDN